MLLMPDVAVRRAAAARRQAVRRCQIDESMQRWLPGRFPFGFQGEVTTSLATLLVRDEARDGVPRQRAPTLDNGPKLRPRAGPAC